MVSVSHTHTRQVQIGSSKPFGSKGNGVRGSKKQIIHATFYHAFDDSSPPNAEYFRELMRVSKNQIIWGGNFFADFLPKASCMIVWDKKRRGLNQADCEIAWTSFKEQSRIFEFRWNGMLQGDMKHKEERIHPTQKPVALYSWLFDRYAKPGMSILDTHMGSGSSRIAAYKAGLDFTGYEIDKIYFDKAEERFQKFIEQMTMEDWPCGALTPVVHTVSTTVIWTVRPTPIPMTAIPRRIGARRIVTTSGRVTGAGTMKKRRSGRE